MKVGDLIRRKDMPTILYRIVGHARGWNAWATELVGRSRGVMKMGMVFKDDDRWEIIERDKDASE